LQAWAAPDRARSRTPTFHSSAPRS
jgi:hypothetical protein